MRAVVVEQHGGPEVLGVVDLDLPEPCPGQVRVDVAASGVNFIDIYERTGAYPMQLPFVAGSEGAGTVSGVGPDVADVSVGDRVAWAMVPGGGYAEVVVLPADRVVPVPDDVSLETAAAVMLQGLTAHYLCESTFPIKAGQTALVHAAAGGLGLLLTQMISGKGARVVGTTSSEEKAALAREAGAAEVVDYTTADWWPRFAGSPTPAAWTWCTTGSGSPPSTPAWTVSPCGAPWCSSAPPVGPCRRLTRNCSTARVRCS